MPGCMFLNIPNIQYSVNDGGSLMANDLKRPYLCQECDFCCSREDILKFHIAKHERRRRKYEKYKSNPSLYNYCLYKKNRDIRKRKKVMRSMRLRMDDFTDTSSISESICSEESLCSICGLTISKSEIDLHEYYHFQAQNYVCTICRSTFKSEIGLKAHETLHIQDETKRNYFCILCDFSSEIETKLKDHINATHSDLSSVIVIDKEPEIKQEPEDTIDDISVQAKLIQESMSVAHKEETVEFLREDGNTFSCKLCPFWGYERSVVTKHITNKHPILTLEVSSLNNF